MVKARAISKVERRANNGLGVLIAEQRKGLKVEKLLHRSTRVM
jgi:hypothetical protein